MYVFLTVRECISSNGYVLLDKDGTCKLSYIDLKNKKQTITLLEKNEVAKQLYENQAQQLMLQRSLQVLKGTVQRRKPAPHKKQQRGHYNPTYILNQRWFRIFNRSRELMETKGILSAKAAASLKFFTLQYLQRVASISKTTSPTIIQGTSLSPLAGKGTSYYRTQDNIVALDLLNNNIKKKFGMKDNYIMSVSNAKGFANVIRQQPNKVGEVSFDDNDEVLERKILEVFKKSSSENSLTLLFDLPELSQANKEKLAIFDMRVNKIVAKLKSKIKEEKKSASAAAFCLLGINTQNPPHDFVWFSESIKDPVPIVNLCILHGFSTTMQQTARILSKEIELDEFPKQLNMMQTTDLRVGSLVVRDFKEFLSNPTFLLFEKMAKNSHFKDFKLLAENMCAYIRGFQKYPVDSVFAENGMTTFLQETYAQVLNFMEVLMSLDYNDPKIKFTLGDFTTLIYENLNFWLEMSVNENEARKHVGKLLENVLSDSTIKPAAVAMTNTGIRCMRTILRTCQDSQPHNKSMTMLSYEDSYYEVLQILAAEDAYKVSPPDYKKSLAEQIIKLKKSQKKLDVVFVDPKSSVLRGSALLTSHNIDEIIHDIMRDGVANKPLTVALDMTNNHIDDKSLKDLLNKYRDQINTGALNIICYRSMQKLDQFGIDKISGGYIQVYSGDESFIKKFQKAAKDEEMDIDPINVKVLAHLYQNCQLGLDQYRSTMFENADYVYTGIEKAFLSDAKTEGLSFSIDVRKDLESSFVCLRFKRHASDAFQHLVNKFSDSPEPFDIAYRASYGFPYTSASGIPINDNESILRLSIGLEDKSKLDVLINTINKSLRRELAANKIRSLVDNKINASKGEKYYIYKLLLEFCVTNSKTTAELEKYYTEVVVPSVDQFVSKSSTSKQLTASHFVNLILANHAKLERLPNFVAQLDKELQQLFVDNFNQVEQKNSIVNDNFNFLRGLILQGCDSQEYVEKTKVVLGNSDFKKWLHSILIKKYDRNLLVMQQDTTWNDILILHRINLLSSKTWQTIISREDINLHSLIKAFTILEKEDPTILVHKEKIINSVFPERVIQGLLILHQNNLLEKPLVIQHLNFNKNNLDNIDPSVANLFVKIFAYKVENSEEVINLFKNTPYSNEFNWDIPDILHNIINRLNEINLQDDNDFRDRLLQYKLSFENATKVFHAYKELVQLGLERNMDLRNLIFSVIRYTPDNFTQNVSLIVNNLRFASQFNLQNDPLLIKFINSNQFNPVLEFLNNFKQVNGNMSEVIQEFIFGKPSYYSRELIYNPSKANIVLKLQQAELPLSSQVLKEFEGLPDINVDKMIEAIKTSIKQIKDVKPAPIRTLTAHAPASTTTPVKNHKTGFFASPKPILVTHSNKNQANVLQNPNKSNKTKIP